MRNKIPSKSIHPDLFADVPVAEIPKGIRSISGAFFESPELKQLNFNPIMDVLTDEMRQVYIFIYTPARFERKILTCNEVAILAKTVIGWDKCAVDVNRQVRNILVSQHFKALFQAIHGARDKHRRHSLLENLEAHYNSIFKVPDRDRVLGLVLGVCERTIRDMRKGAKK